MKKVYLKPDIENLGADLTVMLCSSVSSDKGIDYGGVDEEGELDPASRRYDVWDEE